MRRIKSLGLGALMALALLAVPAGASAAGGIESDSSSIVLKSNYAQMWWTASYTCGGSIATSALEGPETSNAPLSVPATCGRVTANSCKLEFWPGSENAVGIGPSGCGAMKYTQGGCTWRLEPQKIPSAGSYSNTGSGSKESINADIAANLTRILESGACGEKGAKSSIWFSTEFEMNGYDGYSPSQQIGIRAVDAFPQGVYVFGEGSQPQFFAEHFPGAISANSEQFKFASAGEFNMACGKSSIAVIALSGPAQELQFTPSYKNCTGSFGSTVTVDMNSCHYVLDLDNSGAPYSGDLGIACDSEGDKIELYVNIPVLADCVYTLSPPSREVEYSNVGGEVTSVAASIETASVPYVRKGNSVCGSDSTGSLSEEMTLVGVPWEKAGSHTCGLWLHQRGGPGPHAVPSNRCYLTGLLAPCLPC